LTENAFVASAIRRFGRGIPQTSKRSQQLADILPAANKLMLPHEYLAIAKAVIWLVCPLVFVLTGAGLYFITHWTVAVVGAFLCAAAFGVLTYVAFLLTPFLIAKERGSNIDDHLPFALQYMSATSGTGIPLASVLARTGNQRAYGEFAVEMGRLRRDMVVLGLERTIALERAIQRSPSERLKEVLEGLSSTLAAGGSVPLYLEAKAAELLSVHAGRQRKALENLGLLSEVFIVVAVVIPLLLVVLLVSLALFGQSPNQVITIGFQLFTFLVPALYAAFIGAMIIYKPPT
jgi:archaeal flagellar protein FlaJ